MVVDHPDFIGKLFWCPVEINNDLIRSLKFVVTPVKVITDSDLHDNHGCYDFLCTVTGQIEYVDSGSYILSGHGVKNAIDSAAFVELTKDEYSDIVFYKMSSELYYKDPEDVLIK